MHRIRHVSRFAVAFVPLTLQPLGALALQAGMAPSWAAGFPLLFLFGLIPLADWLIGKDCVNPGPHESLQLEEDLAFR